MDLEKLPITQENATIIQNITNEGSEGGLSMFMEVPLWGRNIIRVYICAVAVIGIFGNVLVTTVLGTQRKMSSTDIYVLALAVSDFVSLICGCPIFFVQYTKNGWDKISSAWICKLQLYTQYVAFVVSLLLIVGIAIDRFLKVFKPYTPDHKQRSAAKIACAAMYGVSTVLLLPFLFTIDRNSDGRCINYTNPAHKLILTASQLFVIIVGIASLLITVVAYFKICLFLRKRAVIGVLRSTQEPTTRPFPGTSKQKTTTTIASTGKEKAAHYIKLVTLMTKKLDQKTASNEPHRYPGPAAKNEQSAQSSTRTSAIMVALTIIHFMTRVFPAAIPFMGSAAEEKAIDFVPLGIIFGKTTNPILFAASSSVFRKRARDMFKRIKEF